MASDTLIFGEVGLTGEVRTVSQTELRLKEGAKLGFQRAVLAKRQKDSGSKKSELQLDEVSSVKEALGKLFGKGEKEEVKIKS